MKKEYATRPLKISEFHYEVDIIIPYHGQYEKVTKLVESIYRLTRSNYFNICVVDDFSPNEMFIEQMRRNIDKTAQRRHVRNNFKAIRGTKQRGFAGAAKLGLEHTESPYVCFINSDCIIEDSNWLRSMGETLLSLRSENVRMVAPITNNPVGGHASQQGEKVDMTAEYVVLDEEEAHLSMYCFLCHRELFERCGGFLREYPYGFYEDVEFAWRMRRNGFKQAVCRNSWIHHEGMATVRSIWRKDPEIRRVMEEKNRQRCLDDLKGS